MLAMRDRFVTAGCIMVMALSMRVALKRRRAAFRIFGANADPTLVSMIAVRVMHMTFVKIVGVVAVLNRLVTTAGAVLVIVILMFTMVAHKISSYKDNERFGGDICRS
jgi:hypothetical protein